MKSIVLIKEAIWWPLKTHAESSRRRKKTREVGQPMNIAVADEGRNLIAHIRMDGAWPVP
jgi:uncharacterized protein GlcG (DUF336 family)